MLNYFGDVAFMISEGEYGYAAFAVLVGLLFPALLVVGILLVFLIMLISLVQETLFFMRNLVTRPKAVKIFLLESEELLLTENLWEKPPFAKELSIVFLSGGLIPKIVQIQEADNELWEDWSFNAACDLSRKYPLSGAFDILV